MHLWPAYPSEVLAADHRFQDFRTAENLLTAIRTEQGRVEQCRAELEEVRGHHKSRDIEFRELKTKAAVRNVVRMAYSMETDA